jgi:hypothetical protein
MDPIEGEGTTTTTTAASGAPASHPTPTESHAAGTTGNTAPPANLHREAFDRLARGEAPSTVNRAVFGAGKPKPTDAAAAITGATAAADGPTGQAPAAASGGAPLQPEKAGKHGYPESTGDKDVNVLKRAHMDPETWAAIPPSNRTKILTNLRATQAAADREFQQSRQAGKGARTDATARPNAQTNPPAEDAETLTGDEGNDSIEGDGADPFAQQQQQAAATTGKPAAAAAAAAAPVGDVAAFIDPKDLETLQLIGGDDLAQTLTRTTQRVVQHFQAQNGQLAGVAEFLLHEHIERQFNDGLSELQQLPGLENLSDPSREKELGALRTKADLLHRAAGDPRGYTYQEAMRDAAASLFKTNVHQSAQSRLLSGRSTSLKGSAERGDHNRAERRTLAPKERAQAIFAELQRGQSPDAARLAVDGR